MSKVLLSVGRRILSEEEEVDLAEQENQERLAFAGILIGVTLTLCLILCCLTRCVTGEFRPENTKGPFWFPKSCDDNNGGKAGDMQYVVGNLDHSLPGTVQWILRPGERAAPAKDQNGNAILPSAPPHVVPVVPR